MIPNQHAVLLFRFSEYRWIRKFIEGELSFSCAGLYVHEAINENNNVQGDPFEAVFARLERYDPKIDDLRISLGSDLQIIDDPSDCELVFLRRRSALKKPIFCIYAYKAEDILNDSNATTEGLMNIRHDFDNRIYSGFAGNIDCNVVNDDRRFTQITIKKPQSFTDRLNIATAMSGVGYDMKPVNYELRKERTFFIEPTEKYSELFYKDPKYNYQLEARVKLKNISFHSIYERKTVQTIPYQKDEYEITHSPLYITLSALLKKVR